MIKHEIDCPLVPIEHRIGKREEEGWMWVNTSKGEQSPSVHTTELCYGRGILISSYQNGWNIRDTYMSDSHCSVAECDMYSKVAMARPKLCISSTINTEKEMIRTAVLADKRGVVSCRP